METTYRQRRYPGVKPFEPGEQALFFGRDRDIADLCDLVRVEKTCALFGKSGYGKSSLLQAGVLPRLAAEFQPVEVRFGEYIEGQSLAPLDKLRLSLAQHSQPNRALDFAEGFPDSLWLHAKRHAASGGTSGGGYLFVFDQFEEFFSYPAEQQRVFRAQLAELLHDEMPENLREAARQLPREQRRLLASATELRLLVALRSDRLHELDRMKDYLPTLLHKRYELRALSREQAREAIVGPAGFDLTPDPSRVNPTPGPSPTGEGRRDAHRDITEHASSPLPSWGGAGGGVTPPFEYRDDALQRILDDLTKSNTGQQGGVEAFQLQILCDSIESMVAAGQIPDRDGNGLPDVTAADLPDFDAVYGAYYERRLQMLPPEHRMAARLLLEDGLVRYDPATDTKRRLSVDGDALLASFGKIGLTPALLQELEKTYLLRREPNTLGGFNYELSHDTLLEPVVAARKQREAEEAERRRAAEEAAERERLRAEAERQRAEREKIHRARRRNIAVTVGALLLLGWALWQTWQAGKRGEAAQAAEQKAQTAQQEAEAAQADAKAAQAEAAEQKRRAELEQKKARTKEEEAELAQLRAAEQQRLAQRAALLVVLNRLKEAREEAKELDHAAAYRTLLNAEELGALPDSVGMDMLEIAYWTMECGRFEKADMVANRAAKLLRKNKTARITDLDSGRKVLAALSAAKYAECERRYYPKMLPVPGGTFQMAKQYRVQLSDYQLAESETSFFQYALFCSATGRPLKPHRPSWGFDGTHVAVQVSWYDACLYANWLSKQYGRDTVYAMIDRKESGRDDDSETYSVTIREGAKGFRLPTEAEWQFAAGGGLDPGTEWAGTSVKDSLHFFANIDGEADGWQYTAPVKSLLPNRLGLYDLSGNAEEWCWDWLGDYSSEPKTDPTGPTGDGSFRVLRGGSWFHDAGDCRVSARNYFTPEFRNYFIGFRLASSSLQ